MVRKKRTENCKKYGKKNGGKMFRKTEEKW